MKLVKISDLNEEERKKAFEEQQKRLEENRRISEQNRINANNQFNELINRTGAFDTNNHTTNFYNITNAMKSSGASKQSINAFKKNNHVSLWDSVLDIMNGTGKTVENTWLGLNNGIKSFQQTLGKRMTETQQNRVDFWNEENKRMLEQRAKTYLEEENQIKQAINNPLVTGEQLREGEKKVSEKIQNKKEENLQKINKNIEEIDNPVMKKIAEISPSIGQMVPAFATGGIGAVYMAGSSTGQYYDDAKQRGMSDEEAKTYSGIMGLMEGATEMIGINNLSKAGKGLKELVKGTGKEVAKETAEKVSKSTVKEVLKDYGIGIADNMIQEALIDPIQEFTAQTVAGKDKAQWNGLGNRMLQDAINGGLVGAILGGANLGIQSCTGLVQKYNSNQEITSEEFKTAVKDASKELDTGEMIKQNVQQEVKKYNLQNENVQNNIVDTKGMTFEESASANNIDINNETIKTVSQALSNRDIDGRFDSSYFKNSNENAIWRTYKDEEGNIKREVIFNPNGDSQNTMQQISIHELTHDLVGTKEYEELKNLVLDKNKTRQGYEEARQSLESTYSQVYDSNSENFKSLVDDEEVADTLAQKLGDQDFINSLNVEKPNVFKRIYNWVVDKVNKITGNRFEKVYWEDIKNKFESAYRQDYQGKSNSNRFSIQTDSNGNKFVKIDTNQDIFKGKTLSEQTKIAKQYILDKFRDKGLKLDNENVKITSKTANEYTHPKNQLPYKTKQAKIKASTELDNMLNISDYQYSSNDDGRHRFAKDGWDYYKTVFEVDGVKFEGLVNVAKSGDKKTFYDVTNIKRISQNRSALDKSFSTSLTNSNNSIPTSNDNVNTINNNSMQESENNSGSFNLAKNNTLNLPTKQLTEKQRQNRLEYLKNIDTSNMKLLEKSKIKSEIRALENGYNSVEEMRKVEKEQEQKAIQEYNKKNNNIKDSNKSSFKSTTNLSFKEQQLDIIQKTNPMLDDYHTGIRTVDDIKTFKEAYEIAKKEANNGGWKEYASYPDMTNEMIEDSLKTGEITVYSSNDIKNGTFITPSYEQALEYAGNDSGKIRSKKVKVDDVAWINLDEGQYANLDSTNTRASIKQVNKWQSFLENQIGPIGKGKTVQELRLPTKETIKSKVNLPTKETINTQGEKINWNDIEKTKGKIRKHYISIIESNNTTKEAKAIAKELMGVDTYIPETNKGQLEQADYRINNSTPESELKSLMSRAIQGEKINSVDIAVGERLIQYYSKTGDKKNLQEAIQATSMAGTSAGQTVQALAMLNHQTPQGQATWIQRSVDKMNIELAKRKGGVIKKDKTGNIKVINKNGKDITNKVNLFNLTSDMIEKIVKSANKNEMYKNIDLVYEELGQQVPLSTIEKIDSWRYFSMLANPKTHIRNMLGNFAMGKTQGVKNKLAGAIEDIVGTFNKDMERTKTLRFTDKKTKQFAKEDVLNPDVQSMMALNENKYNPQSRLQNARKTFKSDMLENTVGRLFNWNDKLLEAEDAIGLKSNYKKALENYLVANKIDVDNITDAQLSKARSYAVEQAKEATFHQANAIATAINQISNRNKVAKKIKDATLPFVKTPLNVAKAGVEYNPVGLLKTIVYDSVKLRKGEITVNKYIDNLAKGLTGTGVAVLGYALADGGILKASGSDDDKKEKYDEELGNQTYSIRIGDKTYSLDWLSPVGIPLFVGAELKALKDSSVNENNSISTDDDEKFNQTVKSFENLANAMANSMSPMSEMSMVSGLTSALKSYEQDSTKMLGTMGTNAIKSYVNQFIPTLLGQIARTTDDYERATTSTKTGVLTKAIDQTKLQVMSKIPGLRQNLPVKSDIWGKEKQSDSNISTRIINNFINPATVKDVNVSKVDKELNDLYDKIGETSILPSTIEKTYKINGQTYRMTSKEFSEYKKSYGQTSYKLLNDLIKTKEYEGFSDDQKQKAVESIYEYAKESNKIKYAKENNLEIKSSTLYKTLEELKRKGGKQSTYLTYLAKTKDIIGEDSSKKKIQILANLNCTDITKEIIYKNTEGNKDKKIIVVDKLGLPINQYLRYKSQKFESNKDKDGETVKGSKNQKVYDYLNAIPDSKLSQDYKKIICKMEGINKYDHDIVNNINKNSKLSPKDRVEILTNIGFKIDKNGRIKTKSIIPITKYVK